MRLPQARRRTEPATNKKDKLSARTCYAVLDLVHERGERKARLVVSHARAATPSSRTHKRTQATARTIRRSAPSACPTCRAHGLFVEGSLMALRGAATVALGFLRPTGRPRDVTLTGLSIVQRARQLSCACVCHCHVPKCHASCDIHYYSALSLASPVAAAATAATVASASSSASAGRTG